MSEAFAHEPDRRLVGGHLSLIVDAENDNDVVIGFHGEILRQSTPQSTVTERFAEFSRRNDINPQDVTPDTRHAFATTMHDFVFDDVTQHIRNKIGPEAPIIGVLPRELVEKRLSLFYEQRDPADSDTVRRGLAERAQGKYLMLADSYRSRLKEIQAITDLQKDFMRRGHREAAASLLELKTAYGMTISIFRHRAAMAGHNAVSHTTTAES